jgi:hypothetical protein
MTLFRTSSNRWSATKYACGTSRQQTGRDWSSNWKPFAVTDQAYTDKLDGKIAEAFWQRKMIEWQTEEQRIETAIIGLKESGSDRLLNVKRILELATLSYEETSETS